MKVVQRGKAGTGGIAFTDVVNKQANLMQIKGGPRRTRSRRRSASRSSTTSTASSATTPTSRTCCR